jgi:hypothetical protein
MTLVEKKLDLIQRLSGLKKKESLVEIEKIILAEELTNRANQSIEDIEKGRVHSLEQFKEENTKWIIKRSTK